MLQDVGIIFPLWHVSNFMPQISNERKVMAMTLVGSPSLEAAADGLIEWL